jgi:arginyl-tRNA synthetase
MDILPFDHDWPESFYEDKMVPVLKKLHLKGLLKDSQGAKIVDLEDQGLGIAVLIKSDGATLYLLRDLATFIYRKSLGFTKQLYVVDSRQSHTFHQLFAILKLMGEIEEGEAVHIDYGFLSFKGEALSTRKGNMILAKDVVAQAKEKVAKIIAEKNPDLANKEHAIHAISVGALKYFDLSHNRHSDIEFDWEKVLDFEGDSGPYLQYAYARLSSILRKGRREKGEGKDHESSKVFPLVSLPPNLSATEREILFKSNILHEIVEDSVKDYLPNILANYLYNFATLLNRFYHESPVIAEKDEEIKSFRLALISAAKNTLGHGLELLGIEPLEEM